MIRAFLLPLALVCAFGQADLAFADPVQIKSIMLKETVVETADGPQTIQSPLERATPGDIILIRLTYTNDGATPATDIVIWNPLPAELGFVEAREGVAPLVSVDGGKTFGQLASLRVKRNDVEEPAQPADVTHIRWRIAEPVAPGQSGAVTFAAQLK